MGVEVDLGPGMIVAMESHQECDVREFRDEIMS